MERSYLGIKNYEGAMVKGPKQETIDLLLSYSKALSIVKVDEQEEFEFILN